MQISKSRHLALPLCYAGDNKRTWPQLCTQWACAPPSMRRTTCQPVNHAHTKHTAQVMPTLAWCFVADGLTAVQGGVLRGAGVACPQFAHVGPHSPSICPHSPSFALIWCPQLVHTSTHWLRSTNAAVLVAHQAARRLCRSSHTQSRATALLSCCTRAHMRICARTCTQTHTRTHTCTYTPTHAHTCTHTHSRSPACAAAGRQWWAAGLNLAGWWVVGVPLAYWFSHTQVRCALPSCMGCWVGCVRPGGCALALPPCARLSYVPASRSPLSLASISNPFRCVACRAGM